MRQEHVAMPAAYRRKRTSIRRLPRDARPALFGPP